MSAQVLKIASLGVFTLLLSACTFQPKIISASAHRSDGDDVIEIEVDSKTASVIKSRQIYFSAIVFDCDGSFDDYPAEPYIAGEKASKFKFPTADLVVKITGTVPEAVFDRYHAPCVYLRGGSYFFGKLKSLPISITNTGSI